MSFVLYDIIFLIISTLLVALFLYNRKHNLKREGLLYLYRTKVGIKFIDWTSKRFSKILKPLQYLVVVSGYSLMALMIWFLIRFSYIYLSSPYIAKALKVPVLIPLIPYLPSLFKLDFLPPFYFTYWIIIIAIIAIPHEFAHGIFARLNRVKVHSTGFGFLGPFLAAFVEPDEKQMSKKSNFSQLSVLAAGTFANIIVAIFFVLLMWLFFVSSFTAAGVNFNTYSTSVLNISDISGISPESLSKAKTIDSHNLTFVEVSSGGKIYYADPSVLEQTLQNNLNYLVVYDNSPAFNAGLIGAISEIDGEKITSYESLTEELGRHSPGQEVKIKTIYDSEIREYDIELSERDGKTFLGIGIIPPRASGVSGFIYSVISKVKNPIIYYESVLGDLGIFIYDLLWWTILISISVALVNMIPVGIFDGGRFFYITILALTKNKDLARRAFSLSTWIILLIIALLMIKWILAFV